MIEKGFKSQELPNGTVHDARMVSNMQGMCRQLNMS